MTLILIICTITKRITTKLIAILSISRSSTIHKNKIKNNNDSIYIKITLSNIFIYLIHLIHYYI